MRAPAVVVRPEELFRPSRLVCMLALLLFVPCCWGLAFLFPRGDDFELVTRAMFFLDLPGALYETGRQWLLSGGEYSLHFLQVFLGKAPESLLLCGLVCGLVLSLYGLVFYGLARTLSPALPHRLGLFCGLLAMLGLCCCHARFWQFYAFSQSLRSALPPALWCLLLLLLCRLWLADPPDRPGRRRRAMLLAVLTAGMGQLSALAVLALTAGCAILAAIHQHPARRDMLRVLLAAAAGGLLVFLAPGYWAAQASRVVPHGWEMLEQDWGRALSFLWHGPWLLLVAGLALCLPHAQGQGRTSPQPLSPDIPALRPAWLAALTAVAFLLVSLFMVILRAAGDAFSLEADVLGASLAVYGSVALGMMLFPLLGRAHLWLLVHGRVMSLLLTALLLCLCAGSSNWRETALHAASGSWVVSGDAYQERYNWLWDMGMAYTPLDAPSRFGIWAEWRDGPHELAINELLPRVVVRALPDVALPVFTGDPLRQYPLHWPNLWAAWMFGVGSVRMSPPQWYDEWTQELRRVADGTLPAEEGGSPLALPVPSVLHDLGVRHIWLAACRAVPNATFAEAWLVLDMAQALPSPQAETLEVWRLNPVDPRRMLPLQGQHVLAGELLHAHARMPAWLETTVLRLVASRMPLICARLDGRSGHTVYAVPLSIAANRRDELPGMVLRLAGQTVVLPCDGLSQP